MLLETIGVVAVAYLVWYGIKEVLDKVIPCGSMELPSIRKVVYLRYNDGDVPDDKFWYPDVHRIMHKRGNGSIKIHKVRETGVIVDMDSETKRFEYTFFLKNGIHKFTRFIVSHRDLSNFLQGKKWSENGFLFPRDVFRYYPDMNTHS